MLSFLRWFVRVCFLAMLVLLPACASSCSSTIEPKQSPQDTLFLFDTRATYALTRVLPSSVHKSGSLRDPTLHSTRFAIGGHSPPIPPRSNWEQERASGSPSPRSIAKQCGVGEGVGG